MEDRKQVDISNFKGDTDELIDYLREKEVLQDKPMHIQKKVFHNTPQLYEMIGRALVGGAKIHRFDDKIVLFPEEGDLADLQLAKEITEKIRSVIPWK